MSVVEIHKKGVFSLKTAQELLPVIKNITYKYADKVDGLINELEKMQTEDIEQIEELEEVVNQEIREWHKKMNSLGVKPKGLWIADFDFGEGYFCWKYPEEDILFWHNYDEGYKSRKPIQDYKKFAIQPEKTGQKDLILEL